MTFHRESGFTLIEILVTMAIFGVILGGILKVYDTNNYTYRVQEEMVAMHQNVRVAKMFLERDTRMAGCGVGAKFGFGGETNFAIENQNGGSAGSDLLTIRYIDYEAGTCGTDPSGVNAPCSDLPPLTLSGTMPVAASTANVKEEFDNPTYTAWWQDGCYCGDTTYTQPTLNFTAIITSPDGTKSDIVIVTKAVNTGSLDNLENGANVTYEGHVYENKIINGFEDGSTISFLNVSTFTEIKYYLENGVLLRETKTLINDTPLIDPIAEDIDDLQFAFGLDTDADGTVDAWLNNADLTNDQKLQVRLVRISVLGRTATEHRGYANVRPALEDHAVATTTDGFRRKLIQVTVKVRNLGLS